MKCPHCNGTGELAPEKNAMGSLILMHRKAKGLTQQEVADKSAIGRTQLANIELGRSDVPTKTLQRIAAALEVRAGDLLP